MATNAFAPSSSHLDCVQVDNGDDSVNYGASGNTDEDDDGIGSIDDDDNNDDNNFGTQANERIQRKGPLSKRAAERWAELVVLNDDNDSELSLSYVSTARECNTPWPHAPICPPGSRQHNICINTQPEDFKAILKDGVRCLTRNCAFLQGYMPVDVQTEHFIKLLIKSATKLDKPHYAMRLQKDMVLQKEVCDLLNGRVSHYRTSIKRVAFNLVTHGYGLEKDESTRARQVRNLIHNDRFIFEPKDGGVNSKKPFQHPVIIDTLRDTFFKRKRGQSFAQRNRQLFPTMDTGPTTSEPELPPAMVAMAAVAIHTSLEEKALGVEFNADTYEDSYNAHVATLDEIRERNPPAYHRLMSDLYKLTTNQLRTRVRDSTSNAMTLLDLDGMDV
ncbi:hypothetical protein BJY52DRAFT_1191169 [Lactarius psammicola]|nr:hypothetical protein BJY52DRAFT_1191169 [Lactarius psammicola]